MQAHLPIRLSILSRKPLSSEIYRPNCVCAAQYGTILLTFSWATRWVAQSQWPPSLIQNFFGLDSDPAPYRSNNVRSSFIASMLVEDECSRENVGSKPGVKIKAWSKKIAKTYMYKRKQNRTAVVQLTVLYTFYLQLVGCTLRKTLKFNWFYRL